MFVAIGLTALIAGCGSGTSTTPPPQPSATGTSVRTTAQPTARPPASIDFSKAPAGPTKPTGPTTTAKVARVVDGDTIHATVNGKDVTVRYIGMDAPESVKPGTPVQPYALEASEANKQLVDGKTVVLEKDVSETDQYGRTLRDVWLQAGSTFVLVDYVLVVRGYAQVTTFPPDVKYVSQLLAAQRWARDNDVGLWGLPDTRSAPTQSPVAAATPGASRVGVGFLANCDPSYPDRCIPPPPPDLDCRDIGHRIRVLPPDPHHFDGDGDGIGCESYPP
jgi:micrococcal nuclease